MATVLQDDPLKAIQLHSEPILKADINWKGKTMEKNNLCSSEYQSIGTEFHTNKTVKTIDVNNNSFIKHTPGKGRHFKLQM